MAWGLGVDGRPADGLQSPRAPKALCGSSIGERIRSSGILYSLGGGAYVSYPLARSFPACFRIQRGTKCSTRCRSQPASRPWSTRFVVQQFMYCSHKGQRFCSYLDSSAQSSRAPVGARLTRSPSHPCQGRRGAPSLLERGGSTKPRPSFGGFGLTEAGVTLHTPLGFADEMRIGLRGMVRRVWGRRGVKVRQRLQLVYEWLYLFLVVDGRTATLHWTWIDSMKAEMVGAAVNGLQQQTEIAVRRRRMGWSAEPSRSANAWIGSAADPTAAVQSRAKSGGAGI